MLLDNDIQLVQKLAVGGMAEVWEARLHGEGGFDKRLAIKRLLPHLEENEDFVQLFLNEGRLAAQLNHPNICQIFKLGQHDGRHYIAMEYIDGFNLDTLLRTAAERGVYLPLIYVCHIVMEVCSALEYAHALVDERGYPMELIHRDLSPSNIMLTWGGHIKVVDFGIAKAATQLHQTPTGIIRGKFGYLSPEYVQDKPIDWRSDIFTLGIVFWELLSGRRLFSGESEWAKMAKIAGGQYGRPSEFRGDLPEGLEEIAMHALETQVSQRYETCGHMLEAIRTLLRQYQAESTPKQFVQYLEAMFTDQPLPRPMYDLAPVRPSQARPSQAPTPRPSTEDVRGTDTTKRIATPTHPPKQLTGKRLLLLSNVVQETKDSLKALTQQGAKVQLEELNQTALQIVAANDFDVCLIYPGQQKEEGRLLVQALKQLRPSLPCVVCGPKLQEEADWQATGVFALVPEGSSHSQAIDVIISALSYLPEGRALQHLIQHQLPTPLALLYAEPKPDGIDAIDHLHHQLALLYTGMCHWVTALTTATYLQNGSQNPRINARLQQTWLQPTSPHEHLELASLIAYRHHKEGKSLGLKGLTDWFSPSLAVQAVREAQAAALCETLAALGHKEEPMRGAHLPLLFTHLDWYYNNHWRSEQSLTKAHKARITPLLQQTLLQLLAQLYPLVDTSIVRVDEARQSEGSATNTNHSLTIFRGKAPHHQPYLSPEPLRTGHSYLFASHKREPLLSLFPMLTVGPCPTCHHDGFAFPVRLAPQETPLYRGLICRHLQELPAPIAQDVQAQLAAIAR